MPSYLQVYLYFHLAAIHKRKTFRYYNYKTETIEYSIVPDSAILGKSKEALVKVASASLMELKDAEGKATGSELTLNLKVTNKSSLEAKEFFSVSSSDARLELDNGTSITSGENSGSTNPEPEASSQAVWSFQLLPNASPKKLNFFLDGIWCQSVYQKNKFPASSFPAFLFPLIIIKM